MTKTTKAPGSAQPAILSRNEWHKARQKLLAKEKRLTRALDALAAERRRLPMVRLRDDHVFRGPAGRVSLLDLFEARRQLVVYHYMWHGAHEYCPGCASVADNVGHLAHLHARDTTLALVSHGPWSEIASFKKRMGWRIPWYAAQHRDFSAECGVEDGSFGLSVFLRTREGVFQTYFTTDRGVDRLRFDFNLLDLTPLGRQETWEDSPHGWPQTPPYAWWRLHDEY